MAAHQEQTANSHSPPTAPLRSTSQIIDDSLPSQLAHRAANGVAANTAASDQHIDRERQEDGREGKQDRAKGEEWKPTYGRAQSWDKQDWKHALQMGKVVETGKETGGLAGFSERGGVGQG